MIIISIIYLIILLFTFVKSSDVLLLFIFESLKMTSVFTTIIITSDHSSTRSHHHHHSINKCITIAINLTTSRKLVFFVIGLIFSLPIFVCCSSLPVVPLQTHFTDTIAYNCRHTHAHTHSLTHRYICLHV